MPKSLSPATKGDLIATESRVGDKLMGLERRLEGKLEALETRILDRFELLTENLVAEFRSAGRDQFSLHSDQIGECRRRLTRLERGAGQRAV